MWCNKTFVSTIISLANRRTLQKAALLPIVHRPPLFYRVIHWIHLSIGQYETECLYLWHLTYSPGVLDWLAERRQQPALLGWAWRSAETTSADVWLPDSCARQLSGRRKQLGTRSKVHLQHTSFRLTEHVVASASGLVGFIWRCFQDTGWELKMLVQCIQSWLFREENHSWKTTQIINQAKISKTSAHFAKFPLYFRLDG